MTIAQLPLQERRHANQQLFSDHYLNMILPNRPEWKMLASEARRAMLQIKAIFESYVPSTNEAQLEQELTRPVLEILGHTYEIQASLRTPKGTKKPDYVFYRDRAALNENKNRTLDDAALRGKAFAIGDAKYWDRPLDVSLKLSQSDADINKIPADQIAFYMLHSGVDWGILTNGRKWRLYHKDTAQKQDRFYEVDLKALIDAGDEEGFLYFYAFFHRSAFEPQPLGLDELLRASAEYARGISETLKTQVYDALRHIAQGLLDYPGNDLRPEPDLLKAIYDSSLILLYRLLFILYAEARELLPLRESPDYRSEYSLDALKRDVARRKAGGGVLLPTSARLWAKLKDLFVIIDVGSPQLKVATFNGGLFDRRKQAFLDRYAVGDAHLQDAIDMLARVQDQFVDYRDLAERHLGTIYEGLLEYHLEPIAPDRGWTIDLFNNRGERHRTGSYYTPDFVVQYIVEQTLAPVLDAAVAGKATDAAKIQAILEVNCIDPAMGSGHFPVAAMEYIARYIINLGLMPDADTHGEADLAYWKRRVAQSCIYGVDLNPLAVDLAKLSLWLATAAKDRPLSFLDHHLRCGNALVGSRVTELNLGGGQKKPGKKAAQPTAGQLSMLDDNEFARSMGIAVGNMWLIEETQGNTIAEVREQERIYELLRAELTRKYQKLADLATATGFGLKVDETLWRGLSDYLSRAGGGFEVPRYAAILREVEELAGQQHFFHYDLEFPEVFFDRHGQPLGERGGFDAVIGNPPYVRQELLAPLKPYFQAGYPETYHGTADLFVYFFHQGVRLLQRGGRLAYIASNSWLRANYAGPLRNFLRTRVTVEQLIDLGDNRVFADAPDVYPAIPVVRRELPLEEYTARAAVFGRGEGVKDFAPQLAAKFIPVSIHDQTDSGWQLSGDEGRKIFAKLMAQTRPLIDVINGQIYYGVKTGFNDAFIVDQTIRDQLLKEDPSNKSILKPMLRGEDLRPWYQEDEGRWLIFTRRGINIDEYPSIKSYLDKFRERLEPRPTDWDNTKPWLGRKQGQYKWYEIQDSVDYYESFDKRKIFWPELAKQPRFSWDETGAFVNNKGFIAPVEEPWLLGLLNSRVIWFVIMKTCLGLGERAGMERFQLFTQYISRLPIPEIADQREIIGELALKITEHAKARYELHRRAWRRIAMDLGNGQAKLNQKLTAWWELDFAGFREEIKKVFKREIALKERDDWEEWLEGRRLKHEHLTAEIVRLETELNRRVYALYDLTEDEIRLIEESTKYRYGEV